MSKKMMSTGLDKRITSDDIVGSEFYVSPEMIEKREFSYASDLWALGVILYQMFTGELPFKGKTQEKTFELIQRGQYEMPKDIPTDGMNLIKGLL